MEIPLEVNRKNLLLRGSDTCFELCEHRQVKTGQVLPDGNDEYSPVWSAVKFYATLEGAFQALANMKLRASDTRQVSEVLAEIRKLREWISGNMSLYPSVATRQVVGDADNTRQVAGEDSASPRSEVQTPVSKPVISRQVSGVSKCRCKRKT